MTGRWAQLVAEAEAAGWRVEVHDYVEGPTRPGILGRLAGATSPQERLIIIRRIGTTPEDRDRILAHELEHARAVDRGEPASWHEDFDAGEGPIFLAAHAAAWPAGDRVWVGRIVQERRQDQPGPR